MKQVVAALIQRYVGGPPVFYLQRRNPNEPYPGVWECPGGKIEPNETPEDALRREINEELGIERRCMGIYKHIITDQVTLGDGKQFEIAFYDVRITQHPLPVSVEWGWFTIETARMLHLHESDFKALYKALEVVSR